MKKKKTYTYDYPRPMVTVDLIILNPTMTDEHPQILLIKRKNDPFKNMWALPGGFVNENEEPIKAAKRELKEETNIEVKRSGLICTGVYGKPGRDPRGHTISICYAGWFSHTSKIKAMDDAKDIKWFNFNKLPRLAFDHETIIKEALG